MWQVALGEEECVMEKVKKSSWRPMKTAPEDGTVVFVYSYKDPIVASYRRSTMDGATAWRCSDSGSLLYNLMGWQHIPKRFKAPTGKTGK